MLPSELQSLAITLGIGLPPDEAPTRKKLLEHIRRYTQ